MSINASFCRFLAQRDLVIRTAGVVVVRHLGQQLASERFQLFQIEGLYGFAHGCLERGLDPQDLARIHNVIGVDRLLDRAHDTHGFPMLGDQEIQLAAADAMLSRAGAVK